MASVAFVCRVFLVALMAAPVASKAAYTHLSYDIVTVSEWGTTYRVYAHFDAPGDIMQALYAEAPNGMMVTSTEGFHQDPSGGFLPIDIDPLSFASEPALEFDSWLTIGQADNTIDPPIAQSFGPAWESAIVAFENGGDFVVSDNVGGSVFATPDQSQVIPDAQGRVLIAQLTTTGSWSVTVNIQWRDENFNVGNEVGETLSFADSAVPGCMYVQACNFNELATEDDGSCEFTSCSGCTMESAANFDPSATIDDGSCVLPGCMEAWALNYNPYANVSDGSCIDSNAGCPGDLNFNGLVSAADLLLLLQNFGTYCSPVEVEDCEELASCESPTLDGYTYDVVQIGDQCWFAENLRTGLYANGDSIPNVEAQDDWVAIGPNGMGAWASPYGDPENVAVHGRQYNFLAVRDGRNLCPSGWVVPSDADWQVLESFLGMPDSLLGVQGFRGTDEGTRLKATPNHPDAPWDGTDEVGFTMLESGHRTSEGVWASPMGLYWTSTPWSPGAGTYRMCVSDNAMVRRTNSGNNASGGVRCIQAEDSCYDPDGDGICPEEEIGGCTDPEAENYDPSATEDDGSCVSNSCESPTLDGYTYDVVQIGDQCWFAENLRTSLYLNGDNIETNPSDGWTLTTDGVVTSNADATPDLLYGRSYSWFAVHDGRGLCPSGWKVPSDEEWQTMELTIGMDEAEVLEFGWRGAESGTLLKSTSGWSDMGNGSDAFDFGALPGGNAPDGTYDNVGVAGFWWSESQNVISRHMSSDETGIKRQLGSPRQGFSIRCVQFEQGCVDPDGDGVCAEDEVPGCTSLFALNFNESATENDGTCLFENCGSPEMDGYNYSTVVIGDQCWLSENLRTSIYANGSPIPNVTDGGAWGALEEGARCIYDNNPGLYADLGYLYNWYAVADERSICPSGWHVPTDEEWREMGEFIGIPVDELEDYGSRGSAEQVGESLKTEFFWGDVANGGSDDYGFAGKAGGFRTHTSGGFGDLSTHGSWWSSTYAYDTPGGPESWFTALAASDSGVIRNTVFTTIGHSIRCIQGPPPTLGCTDSAAVNFDVEATVDDGSCVLCDADELGLYLTLQDDFGTGWSPGNNYYFVDEATGDTILTGTMGPGASTIEVVSCLDIGCYTFSTGDIFTTEGWGIADNLGTVYAPLTYGPTGGFQFAFGDAYDECGVCGGDGIPAGDCDCDGNQLDECGVCGGDGIPAGDCDCDGNQLDECGVCGGGGIPAGDCDCDGNQEDALGVCGGDCEADADADGICDDVDDCVGNYDACGLCNGPGAIYDCGCTDIPAGDCDCEGNQLDECGVCGGSGIPAGDCDCDGNQLDECGVCGGDGSSCTEGCTDLEACNYNADAEVTCDGCCEYETQWCLDQDKDGFGGAFFGFNCPSEWPDGVVPCEPTDLCDDPNACNFSTQDEPCLYYDDCAVCGGDGTTCLEGCTDDGACNFDPEATQDDGSCEYPVQVGCMDFDGDGLGHPDFPVFACPAEDPFGFPCEDLCENLEACNYLSPPNEPCAFEDQCGVCGGDDSSCQGCLDPLACNFDPTATLPCSSCCEYAQVVGCVDLDGDGLGNPIYEVFSCNGSCDFDADVDVYEFDVEGDSIQIPALTFASTGCGDCIDNCDDIGACNYDDEANEPCIYDCPYPTNAGCMDETACNYDFTATLPGPCDYPVLVGCIDHDGDGLGNPNFEVYSCPSSETSLLYDFETGGPDGFPSPSITLSLTTYGPCEDLCDDASACNFGDEDNVPCLFVCDAGCTDDNACNFNPNATEDDGSCDYESCVGCLDPEACNYDPTATQNCGFACCLYPIQVGCLDTDGDGLGDADFPVYECGPIIFCGTGLSLTPIDFFADIEYTEDCSDQCDDPESPLAFHPDNVPCDGIEGCMEEEACNYDPSATVPCAECCIEGFDSCVDMDGDGLGNPQMPYFFCPGDPTLEGDCVDLCDDVNACNYDDPFATECLYLDDCQDAPSSTCEPEDFEAYPANGTIALLSPDFSTWVTGQEGGSMDAPINAGLAFSGSQSLRIEQESPFGGPTDVVYIVDGTSGTWHCKWMQYVVPGYGSYFNVQGTDPWGISSANSWQFEVNTASDGFDVISVAGPSVPFELFPAAPFASATWQEWEVVVNVDAGELDFFVDDVQLVDGAAYEGIFKGINFYATTQISTSDSTDNTALYLIDDICAFQAGSGGGDNGGGLGCEPVDFDGYTYDVVEIGDQCWFAENLRSSVFANGDVIPSGDAAWDNSTFPEPQVGIYGAVSNCSGATSPSVCDLSATEVIELYGRLYNWAAVTDPRGLCPPGWTVPSTVDWDELETTALGMTDLPEGIMSVGGWANGGGLDALDFDALPAGRRSGGGADLEEGEFAYWWTSTPHPAFSTLAESRAIDDSGSSPDWINGTSRQIKEGQSIRCIQVPGISGCTDSNFEEFNPLATVDDGSCQTPVSTGCVPVTFDGHTYDVVEISGKCWFAEDLVSTHFANGDPIASGQAGTVQVSMAADPDCPQLVLQVDSDFGVPTTASWQRPGLLEPNDDVPQCDPSTSDQLQAKVYNQWAVADSRNLCPTGWHVASDQDWLLLEQEMGMDPALLETVGNRNVSLAPWLASCSWFIDAQFGMGTPSGTDVEGTRFKPMVSGEVCGMSDPEDAQGVYWAQEGQGAFWYRHMTTGRIFRQDVSLGTLSNLATPVRCVLDE